VAKRLDGSRWNLTSRYALAPVPHCVKWGPSSPSTKGHSPPNFRPMSCDQTAAWIKIPLGTEAGLDPGQLCQMGTQLPPKKGHSLPQYSAHVCCGQTAGSIKMPPGTKAGQPAFRRHCVRWGPSSPKNGRRPPIFGPCLVAKRLNGSRCHLVRR